MLRKPYLIIALLFLLIQTAFKLLKDTEYGYCLLYPAAYVASPYHMIVINPITDPGDMPGDAWVFINVEPAEGRTVAQVTDTWSAPYGTDFNITKSELLIDNAQGVVVDGLPGQDSNRMVFLVSNDRLYTLTFMPWYPNANDPTPLENLYTTIIQTLHFLPPQ